MMSWGSCWRRLSGQCVSLYLLKDADNDQLLPLRHLSITETLRAGPPPPNTINTANEGRFRLNVDSPYGERAQSSEVRCPRAPLRGARRGRAWISFSTWACASRRQALSSFAFTMLEEEGTFDSVSAHLLATAANIFGWAGDPTEWRADFAVANVSGTSRCCKYFFGRLQLDDADVVVYKGSKTPRPCCRAVERACFGCARSVLSPR